MVIAQAALALPIVVALVHRVTADIWAVYGDPLLVDGASRLRAMISIMLIGSEGLLTAFLAPFGRAIAEVGAIIIVGGNIRGCTRTPVFPSQSAANNQRDRSPASKLLKQQQSTFLARKSDCTSPQQTSPALRLLIPSRTGASGPFALSR
jgi:ABC-type molybdate transport system permease subunit